MLLLEQNAEATLIKRVAITGIYYDETTGRRAFHSNV